MLPLFVLTGLTYAIDLHKTMSLAAVAAGGADHLACRCLRLLNHVRD